MEAAVKSRTPLVLGRAEAQHAGRAGLLAIHRELLWFRLSEVHQGRPEEMHIVRDLPFMVPTEPRALRDVLGRLAEDLDECKCLVRACSVGCESESQ